MSQIVSAYIVMASHLASLGELARQGDSALFSGTLQSEASPVIPEYPYSGSVLAVVIDYAEEHGLLLPLNQDHPGAESLVNREAGLVVCAARSDAPSVLAELGTLPADPEEMAAYFEEMAEEEWDEAGDAMAAGLSFLRDAFTRLRGPEDWLLIFID